MPDFWLAI